jgi:hypothetical protein
MIAERTPVPSDALFRASYWAVVRDFTLGSLLVTLAAALVIFLGGLVGTVTGVTCALLQFLLFFWVGPAACCAVLFGLLLILQSSMHLGLTVKLSELGMSFRRSYRHRFVPWGPEWQIAYSTMMTGQRCPSLFIDVGLSFPGGGLIVCNAYVRDLVRLAAIVENHVLRESLPTLLERYKSGENLSFGPLTVSQTTWVRNWYRRSASFDCNQMVAIRLADGWLEVEMADAPARFWLGISSKKVPNLCVLCRVLEAEGRKIEYGSPLCLDLVAI